MPKLVFARHGESEWNLANLFTGWADVDLSENGTKQAIEAGKLIKEAGIEFDIAYTSVLKRAIKTTNLALEYSDQLWVPVEKSWRLNERHYGALQGLNKSETAEKYGEAQVKVWRRSFDVQPPALEPTDERNPALQAPYKNVDPKELPLTESLKDTIARVIPFYEENIKKDMLAGKQVLIAAHGNSLRALVKYLDNISENEITELNIPTGVPLVYEFDDNFNVTGHHYLGDQAAIEAKMNAVAKQGAKK